MPIVTVVRDVQRAKREQGRLTDRFLEVRALGQLSAQRVIDCNLETCLAREEHALRAYRELQVKLHQAEHVGDDRSRKSRAEFVQISPESGRSEFARLDKAKQLHVEVQT